MHKAEIAFFTIGIGMSLITAVWAAAINVLNPTEVGFCWIKNTPVECSLESTGPLLEEYCEGAERGEDFFYYQLGFAMVWVFIVLVLIIFSMTSVFCVVRKQERRASKWSQSALEARQRKAVFTRAAMYISVYFLIWGPSLVAVVSTTEANGMATNTLVSVMLPLQGFFNALIYSGFVSKFLEKLCCCWGGGQRSYTAPNTNTGDRLDTPQSSLDTPQSSLNLPGDKKQQESTVQP